MYTPDLCPPGVVYGQCWCGCGEETRRTSFTSTRRGLVKGQPTYYLPHHWQRVLVEAGQRVVDEYPVTEGRCACGCGDLALQCVGHTPASAAVRRVRALLGHGAWRDFPRIRATALAYFQDAPPPPGYVLDGSDWRKITWEEVLSPRKHSAVTRVRQALVLLAIANGYTIQETGRLLHRDHSTVSLLVKTYPRKTYPRHATQQGEIAAIASRLVRAPGTFASPGPLVVARLETVLTTLPDAEARPIRAVVLGAVLHQEPWTGRVARQWVLPGLGLLMRRPELVGSLVGLLRDSGYPAHGTRLQAYVGAR